MNNVIKRDGREVPFDASKIRIAITKAYYDLPKEKQEQSTGHPDELIRVWTDTVVDRCAAIPHALNVEDIQDIVENTLMGYGATETARSYIRYRYKREMARRGADDFFATLKPKIQATDVQNQNANVDEYSFGGRTGEATNEMMKQYALRYCMSDMARKNHLNNEIYTHDLSSYAVGCHNCFERSVRFITTKGIKSFKDFNDGDECTVLTPSGNWKNATVHCYGEQPVRVYKIKKNHSEIVLKATSNHRWLTIDGQFQTGLKKNDKLLDSPYTWKNFNYDSLSAQGKLYWCYGFVMGDGTLETRWSKSEKKYVKGEKTKVKLCGEKAKYLPRFQENGYGTNCFSFEPEVTGIKFNKQIPDFDMLPFDCLIGFIHGLYDADGTKVTAPNTGKQIYSIQFSDEALCSFVEKYFPVAGLYIHTVKDKTGQITNYGERKFTKNYQFFAEKSSKYNWYVFDCGNDEEVTDVWCLDVPTEHAFVLAEGLPTGNCLSIPFDDLLANGFAVRQTDIRPAGSINTAFQLVAVIMQIQSLMEFGGVAATHLDWTMVPYVRKSFFKHYTDGMRYIGRLDEDEISANLKGDYHFDPKDKSIADEIYKRHKEEYAYAMDMTKRELKQAVEGMFHNLNCLGD